MKTVAQISELLSRFLAQEYPVGKETVDRMAECTEHIVIRKGETLCMENEPFDRMVWVVKGVFRISRKIGKEDHTIAFGIEGDPFTSLSTYLDGGPSVFSFNPVDEGEVLSISHADFKRLVDETEIAKWYNTALCMQVHALENKYVWLGQQDAYSRYLTFMKLRPELSTRVPLKYIASYLGITQATLSRIRARIAGRQK